MTVTRCFRPHWASEPRCKRSLSSCWSLEEEFCVLSSLSRSQMCCDIEHPSLLWPRRTEKVLKSEGSDLKKHTCVIIQAQQMVTVEEVPQRYAPVSDNKWQFEFTSGLVGQIKSLNLPCSLWDFSRVHQAVSRNQTWSWASCRFSLLHLGPLKSFLCESAVISHMHFYLESAVDAFCHLPTDASLSVAGFPLDGLRAN